MRIVPCLIKMNVETVHKPIEKIMESEGRFKMSDGFQLFYRHWSLGDAPQRIVLGLHGAGWHSGQFRQMGSQLPITVPGTDFYAIDGRGFGNSVEEGFRRGDMSSFNRFMLDVDETVVSLRGSHLDKKLYLFGHSGGCLAALRFVASHPDCVDGLILAATPMVPRREAWPPRSSLLRLMFLGFLSPGTLVDLAKYRPKKQNKSDESASVQEDPISAHSKYSVRFLFGAFRLARKTRTNVRLVRVPALVLQGDMDGLVVPEGAAQLLEALSSPDKTLKTFPGADHHFYDTLPPRANSKYDEPTKRQVYDAIAGWLRAH